jgi:hypothetical protein
MALLGLPWISEGLELLLLLFALLLLGLFMARRVMFSLRLRKVRRENMELAREMKKRLKSARLRSLDEIEEKEDEMFRGPPARAKALVIPATYEARVGKVRKRATKRRTRKAKVGKKAAKPPSSGNRPAKRKKAHPRQAARRPGTSTGLP